MFVVNAFFAHLYLGLIRCSANTSEIQIECEAGTFTAGERASVTCTFDTDMSKDKRDIYIEHQSTEKDALACTWSKEQPTYQCTAANGSTFEKVINNRLRLEIPTASKENVGGYSCYIMPSEGTISQPCELDLREGSTTFPEPTTFQESTTTVGTVNYAKEGSTTFPESTTTVGTVNYAKDDSSSSTFLILFIISLVLGLMIIAVLVVIILCRRYCTWAPLCAFMQRIPCLHKDAEIDRAESGERMEMLPMDDGEACLLSSKPSAFEKCKELVEDFRMTSRESKMLVELLNREMETSTSVSVCKKSSKHNADTSLVIDVGTDLTIHHVNLQGDHIPDDESSRVPTAEWLQQRDTRTNDSSNPTTSSRHMHTRQPDARTKKYEMPINKTHFQLFYHLAGCVKDFVQEKRLSRKTLRVALVFSFPSEQDQHLTDAQFTKWTRTSCSVNDKVEDAKTLLQQAFKEKEIPCVLEDVVIVSEDVSTLLWAAHRDPTCKVALIVGEVYNACYLQSTADGSDEKHANKIINKVDLGAIWENASLEPFLTDFDKTLDKLSDNPGNRIMEKMVCMKYLGEIMRLILEELTKKHLLFASRSDRSFSQRGGFNCDMFSLIESETSQDSLWTKHVLEKIQVDDATDEDCRIVQYVTRVVLERAAHLAAAGLATLINRIGRRGVTVTVAVAIGGLSLGDHHPYFKQVFEKQAWKLVKSGLKFKIVPSCVGNEMGAALITAAFEHQFQP